MNFLKTFMPILLLSSVGFAFVLKPSTVVQKTVENSGSGIYAIDLEVQFPTGQEPITLKEQWTVEDENHMKVVVTGPGLHWVFVYDMGIRNQLTSAGTQHRPQGDDFVEKYFHIRRAEHFENILSHLGMVPQASFQKHPYKLAKESDYVQDPYVHLTRVGGTVAIALGHAPEMNDETVPAFYIEQDQFVIRKIRLPSKAEITADKYSQFSRGLNFPRTRAVHWGDHNIVVQTLRVQPKFEKKVTLNLESSQSMSEGLDSAGLSSVRNLVEEFYKRFR